MVGRTVSLKLVLEAENVEAEFLMLADLVV
jgi:hypothetical protein